MWQVRHDWCFVHSVLLNATHKTWFLNQDGILEWNIWFLVVVFNFFCQLEKVYLKRLVLHIVPLIWNCSECKVHEISQWQAFSCMIQWKVSFCQEAVWMFHCNFDIPYLFALKTESPHIQHAWLSRTSWVQTFKGKCCRFAAINFKISSKRGTPSVQPLAHSEISLLASSVIKSFFIQ